MVHPSSHGAAEALELKASLTDERKRLAREIHDRVGNGVSAAIRNLELHEVLRADGVDAQANLKVAVARRLLEDTMNSVRHLVTSLREQGPLDSMPANAETSGLLSVRELQVLLLVAKAMSNRQIASRLSIRDTTVKRHLHNIFRKLDAVSRIDAVNKAVAAKLIEAPWKERGQSAADTHDQTPHIPIQSNHRNQPGPAHRAWRVAPTR